MARSKHFLTYFWLRAERRWRQYRSQVCLSGELAGLPRGCVFVDASKVDVTEWVNTIWGAALLDPDQSSPLTEEDDPPRPPSPVIKLEPDSPIRAILPLKAHLHPPASSFS